MLTPDYLSGDSYFFSYMDSPDVRLDKGGKVEDKKKSIPGS